MHCWKTINLERQFGFYRVFLLSSIIMMMVFSFIYVPINLVYSNSFYDNHSLVFVFGLLSIYPLHKLIHLLPIFPYVKKMRWRWDRKLLILPIVSLRVDRPISKNLYMIALLAPFLVINSILLYGCIQFPHYSHYFAILLAFHSGICAIDFIYAKQLMNSPKNALIEENEDGYEILIYQ
jgi:Putative zincin peptidase